MRWLFRSRLFFWIYGGFPHRLLNRLTAWLMRLRRPRWWVRYVIQRWISTQQIDMSEFEDTDYDTVEDFFLRRLRPGIRVFESGWISPSDGILFAHGEIHQRTILQIKGKPASLQQVINGSMYDLPLVDYEGGTYTTIFLTPNGYHRLHVPVDCVLLESQWIPGRFFPQNADAIQHIPRIYERNERLVLRCQCEKGEFLLVLVGASLIGGIQLTHFPSEHWNHSYAVTLGRKYHKGEEFGHFRFGSTILMVAPKTMSLVLEKEIGTAVYMGQMLWQEKISKQTE